MRQALESAVPLAVRLGVAAGYAQLIIAGAAVLALVGAFAQVTVTRLVAKRQTAYSYLDRFNSPDLLDLISDGRDFWFAHDWPAFEALTRRERGKLLIVPNLIEEVASQYNRNLLDRDLAAMVLGAMVETLWIEWQVLITGGRIQSGVWTYREWERMQRDTRIRREREHRRMGFPDAG